ncbi:DUF4105 domain-containing protein, partial [bacterium]|nr:DUF4105 domain-containing protein [bacterium]
METIKSFFKEKDIADDEIPHQQCRFIARFRWLDQNLGFDYSKLKKQPCLLFNKWFSMLNPESISLIFPSYDLFSPGSMFGHTLLRINTAGNSKTSILNYAINHGAVVPNEEEGTIPYPIKGVFGGYYVFFQWFHIT